MAHIFERKPGKKPERKCRRLAWPVCCLVSVSALTLFNAVRQIEPQGSMVILSNVERITHCVAGDLCSNGLVATVLGAA
jgi:hypothetical protein